MSNLWQCFSSRSPELNVFSLLNNQHDCTLDGLSFSLIQYLRDFEKTFKNLLKKCKNSPLVEDCQKRYHTFVHCFFHYLHFDNHNILGSESVDMKEKLMKKLQVREKENRALEKEAGDCYRVLMKKLEKKDNTILSLKERIEKIQNKYQERSYQNPPSASYNDKIASLQLQVQNLHFSLAEKTEQLSTVEEKQSNLERFIFVQALSLEEQLLSQK